MAELVVRRADDRDLPELVRSLGQEHYFTDRVAAQRDGRGVLVAAFLVIGWFSIYVVYKLYQGQR